MLKEFIIGLQPSPVTLTDNSDLKELILITERTSKIEIVPVVCDGDEIVSAILFDGGDVDLRVRDTPISPLYDEYVDNPEIVDDKASKRSSARSLDLSTPFLKSIRMQQTCYSASDQPHLYWRRITYLRLDGYDGKHIAVGKLRTTIDSIGSRFSVLPEENVDGPCMIAGVGMHNKDLIALQIISSDKHPTQIDEHLYAYGKSSVGLVNLRPAEGFAKIEKANFVGIEASDPDVLNVINKLYGFMARWYSSRSSIHRMFPDLYSIIDYSITQADRNIIFSAFRLERHLRYRIRNQSEGHAFDRDPFLRSKLFQVVHSLASTLERCQRIIVHKPSMNCYCIGYLSGDTTNYLIATLVLATQLSLTYVLLLSLLNDEESENDYFQLRFESMLITPIIAIFSAMLVWKQISNIIAIKNAYPGMRSHLMGLYEIIANGLLGVAVLVIQIILLLKQQNRVDYVLNSIATIFILELDDTVVFLDEDGITDLHRRMLMKDFQRRIKSINDDFFKHENWMDARNYFRINTTTCSIETLPNVKFADNRDTEEAHDLEPLKITFACKSSVDASGEWVEIASSKVIFASKHLQDSTADLKFTWHDQGGGNRKGQLRVRLLDALTDDDVASSPVYGIAPHEETVVTDCFDLNHGLVRHCAEGYRYVVEVVVGGGGGHALYVKDFEFKSSPCLVQKDPVVESVESEYSYEPTAYIQ